MTKIGKSLSKGLLAVLLAVPLSASASFVSVDWSDWDVFASGSLNGDLVAADPTVTADLNDLNTGADDLLTLISSDYRDNTNVSTIIVYATANTAVDFTFNWTFEENTTSSSNTADEQFGFLVGNDLSTAFGARTTLASPTGTNGVTQSGTNTVSAANTQVFGWFLTGELGKHGSVTAIIEHANASAVPAPATLALLGFGLVGLGFISRRKA